MRKFHICTQILQGNALFSGKDYTAGKKLHDRQSRDGRENFKSAAWQCHYDCLFVAS